MSDKPTEWFVNHGGKIHGPFSAAQLKQLAKSSKINGDTQVRFGSESRWTQARNVKGLFESRELTPVAKPATSVAVAKPPAKPVVLSKQSSQSGSRTRQVRCPHCHEYVDAADFPAHQADHTKLRPDGQLTQYVTLPTEEREQGSLEGVPQWYSHSKCGAVTGMPEEIIRSYLKNPYLYSADATFCTGCGEHYPFHEFKWTETGENLQTYMNRLRAEKPELRPGVLQRIWRGIVRFLG